MTDSSMRSGRHSEVILGLGSQGSQHPQDSQSQSSQKTPNQVALTAQTRIRRFLDLPFPYDLALIVQNRDAKIRQARVQAIVRSIPNYNPV